MPTKRQVSRSSCWSRAWSGFTPTCVGAPRRGTEPLLGSPLYFQAQRVERIELVERGLGPHAVRVFRGLDRLDHHLDLLWREVDRPVDDLFHLDVSVDRSLDHVIGVRDDLRTRRPEELFRSC